ncbi:MAG: DUF2207 domain-containing protein [Sediminicola sp.]
MKNLLSAAFFMLLSALGWGQDFTVNNYTVDIHIREEGHFEVVEMYDLTFEAPKHGIFRTIRTQYDLQDSLGNLGKRKIKIKNIQVPDHKFDAPFDFVQRINDDLEIKIGDKDITLIGPQRYEIRYEVQNAFLFQEDRTRFYWNIKPDGWEAIFHAIHFTVHAPNGVTLNAENCFVYSGESGTGAESADFNLRFSPSTVSGKSIASFRSFPGESVTVLIDLPVGSVKEIKPLWPFWDRYGWLFIVGGLIGVFLRVWWQYGKDAKVIATTTYFPPSNIDPAMAGFLINDREDTSDLISLLPHWGTRGLISIQDLEKEGLFGKKDTRLTKLADLPADAPDYERALFDGLFDGHGDTPDTILVSSLKDRFHTTMASARSHLKKAAQPYYEPRSSKVQKTVYLSLAAAMFVLGWVGLQFWGILAAISIILTCLALLAFNFYMVKKNALGNRMLSELKGFRQFIKVAEVSKLRMLIVDDPHYFESTMGYALAFGLFKQWAEKFDGLDMQPPGWYSSTSAQVIGMHHFSKSFSSSMAGAQTNMVSTPSSSGSSGGGSSGGGFGGGGGGSW